MNPFQTLKCVLGYHLRSAKKVVRDESGRFTSICVGCGVPMWRYIDCWTSERRNPVEVTTMESALGDKPGRYRPIDE